MSDLQSLYPCGRIARRRFLFQSAAGFLGSALSSLWAQEGKLMQDPRLPGPAKAKSVIFLFMCGGVSHIDTFDPKDNKHAGKIMDAIGFGDNNAPMKRPVIPILRTYKQYGKSGIAVSDWFPNVGESIDDIAVVRSMYCHQTNHFPAVLEGATGKPLRQFEHPCLGSWVSYALGTANKDLPTFVNIGRPSSPVPVIRWLSRRELLGRAFPGRRCADPRTCCGRRVRGTVSGNARCRRSSNWTNSFGMITRSKRKSPAARGPLSWQPA